MAIHRAAEDHHHTPEEVRGYLDTAVQMVMDANLPTVTGDALLPTLVTLLASKQVWYQEVAAMPHMAIPRNHR